MLYRHLISCTVLCGNHIVCCLCLDVAWIWCN